jgi:hypothetical protein
MLQLLADAASEGKHVHPGTADRGLIFIGVIVIGQLTHYSPTGGAREALSPSGGGPPPTCASGSAPRARGRARPRRAEVDPDLEITEIVDRDGQGGRARAALREPEGLAAPLLINQFGTERRMCLAFGARSSTTWRARSSRDRDAAAPGARRKGEGPRRS